MKQLWRQTPGACSVAAVVMAVVFAAVGEFTPAAICILASAMWADEVYEDES